MVVDAAESEAYPSPRVGGSHPPTTNRQSIHFLATDHGGGGRTRSFFPAEALAARGWDARADTAQPLPGSADVLVLHRPCRPAHLALLRAWQERGGQVIVQEDDDLSNVQAAGISPRIKSLYTPALIERHDQAIAEADGLIVSTPRLAEVYGGSSRRTWIVRNYLPRWIGAIRPGVDDGQIRVVWGGRVATHQGGLAWLRKVSDRMLSGAMFLAVGDGLKTCRYLGVTGAREVHAYQADPRRYYALLGRGDVAIVPLDPTDLLNWSKSALKGQEAIALGQPVVAARTPEYEWLLADGKGGMLAETPSAFAESVQQLIHDPDYRAVVAAEAWQKAEGLWLEDHVGEWERVFDDLRDLLGTSGGRMPAVPSGVLPRHRDDPSGPVPVLPPARDARRVEVSDRPTVAVAMPSRGTMHSRTVEALLVALARAKSKTKLVGEWWSFAHGEPIPEAHEAAAARALETGAELVWFIEEDNLPPADALLESIERMRETGAGVVAVAYPVGEPPPAGDGTRWNTIYRENGEILFTGLGITLVHRDVFERLEKPWFRTDRQMGTDRKLSVNRPYLAGGIDVSFGVRVREAGFVLESVPGMVGGHLRTLKHGARPLNRSPHDVEVWDTIQVDQHLFRGRDSTRFVRPKDWKPEFRQLRPWVGRYLVGGHWQGNTRTGAYDPVHDPRVAKAIAVGGAPWERVLELGALEGGHSAALAQQAQQVVALEGREQNLQRARLVLRALEVTNVQLRQADLETAELADLGDFDLVFSVGVLYHMTDPIRLLDQMRAASDRLFLWTHHAEDQDGWTYREGGMADPLSGLHPTSTWLSYDRLIHELETRYEFVTVLDHEPDRKPRPAVTISAGPRP